MLWPPTARRGNITQNVASPGRVGPAFESSNASHRQPVPFPASLVCGWESYFCSSWMTNQTLKGKKKKKQHWKWTLYWQPHSNDIKMFARIFRKNNKAEKRIRASLPSEIFNSVSAITRCLLIHLRAALTSSVWVPADQLSISVIVWG